jgi:hypothetical protein
MMYGRKTLGAVAGAFVLCAGATAIAIESGGTPYQGIVDRNVFGLKPPPPPPDPEANKPPPPNIKLTGIITMFGKKQALMKVVLPPKPGVKQEEQSYILAVGQRDGDIEVLDIDEKAGIVKVNDFGTVTNLNFTDNGVKLASGPAPGAPVPGAPPMAAGGIPQPPGAGIIPPGGGYVPRQIPTPRPMRTGAGYTPAYPTSYGGAPPQATYTAVPVPATGGTMPVTTTPGTTASSPGAIALSGFGAPASTPTKQQNWPPESPSPEAQAIADYAYKTKYASQIQAGTMPDIPGGNALQDMQNTGNSGQTTQPVNRGPQRLPNGQIVPGSTF